MPLIIEDGAGVAGADSYATEAENDAWAIAYHGEQSGAGAPAMRRAYAFMNSLRWKGEKTHGRDQTGAWPRDGFDDIANDEIPAEVIKAQHAFARAEAQSPGALSPVVVQAEKIKREKVGPLEVEYADTANSLAASRAIVTEAMDAIAHLLEPRRATIFLERA